ncbi:MAG: mechanosensitive ion channel family protein [Desulfurococcales archaeon]|nr:mechanosensitive ion channel family protein [Desulfurococcales archaeon]
MASSALASLESLEQTIVTNAGKVLVALAILVAGILFAVLVKLVIKRSLYQRLPAHVYKPLESAVYYSLLILAGVAALTPFGISLSSLVIAGGFAGIVVGLATQSTLSNLVSGIMILIEQPLKIGDPVTISNYSGIITGINVFSTLLRTWDGPIVRIPNNEVFNSIITNYSRMKARRVEFAIGVHYESDIDHVVSTLKKFMEEHPLCLVNPGPEVFVDKYGDSSIVFKMRCWTPTQAWFATKIELQTRLKKVLEEAGIKIPYPQLDVHFIDELRVRLGEPRREGKD